MSSLLKKITRPSSLFLAVACCLCLLNTQAYAAPQQNSPVPTNIKADSMEYDAVKQTVVFTNNVHVTRPDFELWSKKLTVYLKKDKKKNSDANSDSPAGGMQAGDIDHIVAQGNVRFKSENKSGECQKATYYITQEKIVMEGNPVLRDPESTVSGNLITHYMKENRSVVSGTVSASFETPDQTQKESGQE